MTNNLQTTDFEDWKEIAQAINNLQEAQSQLLEKMNVDGNVPKTVYNDQYHRLSDAQSKLKSDLEDRMFREHPDKAETYIFYTRD